METAAWMSSHRTRLEPALVIRPQRCVSPELSSRGTRPREASTSCARRKRAAGSSAATKAAAVTGPMLGTLGNQRTRSSVCVTAAIRSSASASGGSR
jgi:hypothetical protein